MCTINLTLVKGQVIGWKVVTLDGNKVVSYYKRYYWRANKTHAPSRRFMQWSAHAEESMMFHCFARRKDARNFKKGLPHRKIIRLVLSGASRGLTMGMGEIHNNLPAVCGKKAYWDGKFYT